MEARDLFCDYGIVVNIKDRIANRICGGSLFELVAGSMEREEDLSDLVYVMSKLLLNEMSPDAVASWLLERHPDKMERVLRPIEYARVNNMAQRSQAGVG